MTLLPPTLNGNIITVNLEGLHNVFALVQQGSCKQFSVVPGAVGYLLSTPVTEAFQERFIGMVHGARARASEKPDPKPPTGGGSPDGTPPGGGTPGSTSVWQQTYTEARAA
jgi:hypothetical protein